MLQKVDALAALHCFERRVEISRFKVRAEHEQAVAGKRLGQAVR